MKNDPNFDYKRFISVSLSFFLSKQFIFLKSNVRLTPRDCIKTELFFFFAINVNKMTKIQLVYKTIKTELDPKIK